MAKTILIVLTLFFCTAEVFAQQNAKVSADFSNDGCSLFPDGNYRVCCVEHDKSYFQGGTWRKRRQADNALFKCVASKNKFYNKLVAPVMWLGVRVGGVGFLPTSFRWGFGRAKEKKTGKSGEQKESLQKSNYE